MPLGEGDGAVPELLAPDCPGVPFICVPGVPVFGIPGVVTSTWRDVYQSPSKTSATTKTPSKMVAILLESSRVLIICRSAIYIK